MLRFALVASLALVIAAPCVAQLGMSDGGADSYSLKPNEPRIWSPGFPGEMPPFPGAPFSPHVQPPTHPLRPGCPVEIEDREGGLILQVFRALEPGSPRGEMMYLSVLTAAGYAGKPVSVEYRIAGSVDPEGGDAYSLVRIPVSAPGTRHEAEISVTGFIYVQATVMVESRTSEFLSAKKIELSASVPAAVCH